MAKKSEETRERILDTSLALFRERGFDATTMRDVASEAGVATGAAYYYFRAKEDLVLAFYLRTADEARELLPEQLAATKELRKRILAIVNLKYEQFAEHRELLTAMLKVGTDPRHPLSPFGKETKAIREESIDWFARALEGTSVPKDIGPYLPRLLWLWQMALLMYWLWDETPGQRRTQKLTEATLDLILQLLKLGSLPLMGPVRKRVVKVLRIAEE
ncbi:MAG TPA: TetR/AcrR family transcriptional regulator [Thermoanaerobaculia bacterium]